MIVQKNQCIVGMLPLHFYIITGYMIMFIRVLKHE